MNKFLTYSGALIDFTNLVEDDINLIDIAHHLTNINRFGGSLDFDKHYSVAEHSLLLTNWMQSKGLDDNNSLKLILLHDASEAYLGDIVSGLKKQLSEYKAIESTLQTLIYQKYKAVESSVDAKFISVFDKRIAVNEFRALMPVRYNAFIKAVKFIKPLPDFWCSLQEKDHEGCFRQFSPGKVPKQVVFDAFLKKCEELNIND